MVKVRLSRLSGQSDGRSRLLEIFSEPGPENYNEGPVSREHLFRIPPLTPDLIRTAHMIIPHLSLKMDEVSRQRLELDQNGTCWAEHDTLAPVFKNLASPLKVLEIGPGLGRSAVFLSRMFHWNDSTIHFYEGDGTSTKYTLLGPRFEDSFCGDITQLGNLLLFNGMKNIEIFDAAKCSLPNLPGPYDLIYSFYAVGFHWRIEHFLSDFQLLMHERTICAFTVPHSFTGLKNPEGVSWRACPFVPAWPKGIVHKMLFISRDAGLVTEQL